MSIGNIASFISVADGAVFANSMGNMFGGTGGSFKGTPNINTTYYLDTTPPKPPTPGGGEVTITYNGETIADFESGSKTLACGGKVMASDVVVTLQ